MKRENEEREQREWVFDILDFDLGRRETRELRQKGKKNKTNNKKWKYEGVF